MKFKVIIAAAVMLAVSSSSTAFADQAKAKWYVKARLKTDQNLEIYQGQHRSSRMGKCPAGKFRVTMESGEQIPVTVEPRTAQLVTGRLVHIKGKGLCQNLATVRIVVPRP